MAIILNNIKTLIGGDAQLPTLSNPGTKEDLMLNKELIDGNGNKVIGTFTIDNELIAQDNLIDQIQTALEGKASASQPILQSKTVTPTTSSQNITADSGYDGLSNVTVNAMPTATQATPSISINSNGLITASATQSAGYVSAGTKSATKQLTTKAATTITPSTSSQTAVASGVYTTGAITVNPIPSEYVNPTGILNITTNGAHNVTNYATAYVNVEGGVSSGTSLQSTSVMILSAEGAVAKANIVNLDGTLSSNIQTSNAVKIGTMYRNMIYDVPVNTLIIVDVGGATAGGSAELIQSASTYTIFKAIATTCCFVAGTQVLTSLDGTTAAIESLKEGDTVVSYNIETGENYIAKVNKLIIKENVIDIAEVYFNNGASLTMHAYHPIYTMNGFHSITNHNNYDTLVVGDIAKTVDGWTEITEIKRYISEPITTYNLDVIDINENPDNETNDTFYANGIVVHNSAPIDPDTPPGGPGGGC